MDWGKDKKEEEPEDIEITIVCCNACGHKGPMSEFLQEDAGDTRCPRCGEDEDLVFEM